MGDYKYRVTGPRGGKYLTTTRKEAEALTKNGGSIRALGQKKASKVKNPKGGRDLSAFYWGEGTSGAVGGFWKEGRDGGWSITVGHGGTLHIIKEEGTDGHWATTYTGPNGHAYSMGHLRPAPLSVAKHRALEGWQEWRQREQAFRAGGGFKNPGASRTVDVHKGQNALGDKGWAWTGKDSTGRVRYTSWIYDTKREATAVSKKYLSDPGRFEQYQNPATYGAEEFGWTERRDGVHGHGPKGEHIRIYEEDDPEDGPQCVLEIDGVVVYSDVWFESCVNEASARVGRRKQMWDHIDSQRAPWKKHQNPGWSGWDHYTPTTWVKYQGGVAIAHLAKQGRKWAVMYKGRHLGEVSLEEGKALVDAEDSRDPYEPAPARRYSNPRRRPSKAKQPYYACEACGGPALPEGVRCRDCAIAEIESLLDSPEWMKYRGSAKAEETPRHRKPGWTMADEMRADLRSLQGRRNLPHRSAHRNPAGARIIWEKMGTSVYLGYAGSHLFSILRVKPGQWHATARYNINGEIIPFGSFSTMSEAKRELGSWEETRRAGSSGSDLPSAWPERRRNPGGKPDLSGIPTSTLVSYMEMLQSTHHVAEDAYTASEREGAKVIGDELRRRGHSTPGFAQRNPEIF